MYKSMLNELCQKKMWELPVYSSHKKGPDHAASFFAAVTVQGIIFEAPSISRSYKAAENSAAAVAWQHFTSDVSQNKESAATEAMVNAEVRSSASRGIFGNEAAGKGPKFVETLNGVNVHSDGPSNMHDGPNQYKTMLQIYAQKIKLGIPVYSSESEGPPHAPCFKAIVTVGGCPFESPEVHKSLKEAENAAAKVALMSLATDAFQENFHSYKCSLQELAQKEGFMMPKYKTVQSGESHQPTFFAIVEVEGESFNGTAAKTKKQAESNAAMKAYTALMERKANWTGKSTAAASSDDEAVDFTRGSHTLTAVDPSGSSKSGGSRVSNLTAKYKEQVIENKVENQSFIESPASPKSSSSTMTLPDVSTLSITDSNKKSTESESLLLGNRFRAYKGIPTTNFPEGTVLMPIAEDIWVPVRLEFPDA